MKFYGYTTDVLCNMLIQEINQLSLEEVSIERNMAIAEKRNMFVFPHKLKDGSVRTVEVFSSPIKLAGNKLLYSIIHDVTDRKIIEEQIRVSNIRLNACLEGTKAATWEWNIKTGETVFNERWAEIVGYTLEELAPISIQTWINMVHP